MLTAGLALAAGAPVPAAVRLGVAMVGFQFSIGALNDLRDAPADAGQKLRKPIPLALVGVGEAWVVWAAGLAAGALLSAQAGPATLAIGLAGASAGYLYDLRLKGTALSWLPFALGIPLLPVFAWVGATGGLPGVFVLVLPLAALAGSGLAVANALGDLERDQAAGVSSIATRLGLSRAWQAHALLLLGVVVAAVGLAGVGGGLAPLAVAGMVAGSALVLAGVATGRGGHPGRRELAWEVEAAGIGLVALAWLAGVAAA